MKVIHSQPQNREMIHFTDLRSLSLIPEFEAAKTNEETVKKIITLSFHSLLTTKYMKLQEADKIPLSKRLLNANFKLCCNLGIGAVPAGGKDLGITGMLKMKLSRHVTVMWINI